MSTFNYVEDKNMSHTVKPQIQEAKFGDGYSQRLSNSINNLKKEFSLSFANRSNSEADGIVEFLEARAGAESFDWTPTGYSNSIKVICKEWTVTWTSHLTKTVEAKFNRVFES